ncbi:spore germination lipoprotein GerD [Marinicrinis lubricantis]|uniref:Spore germination lipoprotein GerD n=1 Tax=Marinicrinis lubricantis TaxID=2086470 RepID=A0ABW1IS76_9BACL
MNSRMLRMLPLLLLVPLILSSCGSDQGGGGMTSYKEMKSMVVDILKTEDGQKAIEEATKKKEQSQESQAMQLLSTGQGQQIKVAVKEVLTDPQFSKTLQTMMTDPKFAGEFAKAVQKENEQIHKSLMKDPEYQTLMLQVMKDPEYEKMLMDVMKGKQYRQQMMTVMQEALKSPIFRLELMDMMKKVLEEESKPKEEGQQSGGGGGGSGGSGGGS